MKRDDTYKEFNNQNYLEIKFSKKSTTEESIKEAKKILEFKNKLIFNLFLNKREMTESNQKEKQTEPAKEEIPSTIGKFPICTNLDKFSNAVEIDQIEKIYGNKLKKIKDEKNLFQKNIERIRKNRLSHEEFLEKCLNHSRSKVLHPFNNRLSSFYK